MDQSTSLLFLGKNKLKYKMKRILKKINKPQKIFFAILIAFAVISFWRGVWGLMDLYLFPNDYELSLWISVMLGIGILILSGYSLRKLI